jgi:hypothetical protein
MVKLDMRIDKRTGLPRWWLGDIIAYHSALSKRGPFLLGFGLMNGALGGWVTSLHGDKTFEYVDDLVERPYHSRIEVIKLIDRLRTLTYIPVLYRKGDKEIQVHVDFSTKANKDRKIKDQLKTIIRSGILKPREDGKNWTPDLVWNSLPKTFAFALGELHGRAVEALRASA